MTADPTTVAAVRAASRWWHVFPCRPGTKTPVIEKWPSRTICDPSRVRREWPAGYNVGIACEPSGLVVIDLDCNKPLPPSWQRPGIEEGADVFAELAADAGEAWPDTYTVRTPSGGWHLYFRNGGHLIRNSVGNDHNRPMVDVRAAGGFVIAAGSIVDGRPYEELSGLADASICEATVLGSDARITLCGDVDVLPDWLAVLLKKPAQTRQTEPAPLRPAPKPVAAPDRYVNAAFQREINEVATAWEGSRNHQLNKSAFSLARFVASGQLDRDTVISALTRAGEHVGLQPHEIRRTLRSAFEARGAA